MYRLEKMQIHGFKSFYDRTDIVLPARTTAVVGPNGCGKSNISDAIHWVLGEQRVSTLRGEKMEDVIFNGSERRKPLGMAEVSLFLSRQPHAAGEGVGEDRDGAPGSGNGEWTAAGGAMGSSNGDTAAAADGAPAVPLPEPGGNGDGAEASRPAALRADHWPETIRITRRLFRDGQSDYLIDGARCRLRDVKDLLHRVSVGSGASSIIEQGKVGQIVASKPRERRILIEEAAGIAGFKAKKREATLKLEATEANLARIEDVIVEVRRQINSSKRQAAKARRYQRLMEERRGLERIAYHQRATELDARLRDQRAERARIQDEEAEASKRLATAEAEAQRLRAEVEEGDRRLAEARELLHALDLQVDREERSQAGARKEATDLEAAAATAHAEATELDARAQEAAGERDRTVAEADELGVELRRLVTRAEASESAAAELRAGILAAEAALEESRRQLLGLVDEISGMRGRCARLTEESSRATASIERADHEAAEAAAEQNRVTAEIAALDGELRAAGERSAQLGEESTVRARQAGEARQQLDEAERAGEQARLEHRALGERLETLSALDREGSPQARAARAAGPDSRGLVADYVRPDAELEPAAEGFLADLLPAAVVENDAAVRRALSRLQESGAGRASFLILDGARPAPADLPETLSSHPRVRGRLARLLGTHGAPGDAVQAAADGCVVVDDLATALELLRAHPERTFLTVAGELVRPGGLVTAGSPGGPTDGILALRREIRSLGERLARADEEARRAARRAEELRAAIAADAGRAAAADRQRAAMDVSAAELRERRRALEEARDRAERLFRTRSAEADSERVDQRTRQQALAEERAALQRAEADREARQTALGDATERLNRQRGELASATDEVAEGRARAASARMRLETLATEGARLGRALEDLTSRATRSRDEAAGRLRRAAELRALAERTGESLRRNLERRGAEKQRLDADAEALEERRGRGAERGQEAKGLQAVLEQVRARRMELEVALSRAESERGFLEQSCRNDLEQSLAEASAALAEGEADVPAEEVTAGLEDVRRRIDSLGPVNVMAMEEFAEIETRYNFLTSQQKDLQDSVRSLKETIGRINRQSRERFQVAFEAIRKNFQETFRLLFGGGRADLHLEEEVGDILESGVEIAAQPPGKRLQRIALLSGGEKALTAIALLFGIFQYRPSPFCILDEVDAPLDEANIHRYTELLRRMAEDTQFVIITHNKRTMERSDVLYGVTMEEPGVSKLVSVRFEDDGRLATADGAREIKLAPPRPRRSAPSPGA